MTLPIRTIAEVRTAIKNKLDTLTGDGKVFVSDYNYFTTKTTGFPCVMFEPSELSSVYEDTAYNYRSYTFNIVIVQEMNTISRSDAMDILLNCFEKVIDAFDQDWTLSGVVEQVDATGGTFGEIDMEK
jgi:hypothetical protein